MARKLFGYDVVIWSTGKVTYHKDGICVRCYIRPQRRGFWSSVKDCKR
jgi:hypothetical protein